MNVDEQALKMAESFCERCRDTLGENLVSFGLYGSAVRGNMVKGRSDINVLVVLNQSTPQVHRVIAELVRHSPRIAPFVLSRWELPRSRSVFAIKFKSIARHLKVLYGEDPLADFAPSQSLLLFLCEQSLRNLRLRLKHAYIHNANKLSLYRQALSRNVTTLFVTLSEVLRCAEITVPEEFEDRPEVIGALLNADASILQQLLELRKNPGRQLSAEQAFEMHSKLFHLLSAALDKVREQWPQATAIQ